MVADVVLQLLYLAFPVITTCNVMLLTGSNEHMLEWCRAAWLWLQLHDSNEHMLEWCRAAWLWWQLQYCAQSHGQVRIWVSP